MRLTKYLPKGLRLFLKIQIRKTKDLFSGESRLFNSRKISAEKFEHSLSVVQVIRKNENFKNKLHNLQKGIDAISGRVIQPQEIFSFWQNVGKPDRANGFQLSRNIVSGQVSEDYGGGLCQLSSIIYHLSLKAGFVIKERFNHSIDIYKEEDRFTPLGADATVVYGYKDLRIQNPLDFPVMIFLKIEEDLLTCSFLSNIPIREYMVEFQRKELTESMYVLTINELNEVLAKSVYKKPKPVI